MNEEDINNEFNKRKQNITKDDLNKVLENANKIKNKSQKGPLTNFWEDINLMYQLLKDYKNGEYKEISWGVITSVIVALLYILSPIDLIPDFIPFFGFTDDAMIVALCLRFIGEDLEKYKKFKKNKENLKNFGMDEL